MTRTERIQWQIFILLIIALVASIYYFSARPTDNPTVSSVRKIPTRADSGDENSLPELSMLQQQPPEFSNVKRNVFKFGDGSDGEDQTSIAETEPLVLPDAESELPTPTGPDVTYLGFYHEREGSERKLGAISNGGQIYVGGEGEILGGKYKVLRLEDEYMDIEYLPEHRIIHLKLGRNGNAPPSS
jgi:hypothetical protein